MSTLQKFQFDTDFDELDHPAADIVEEALAEPEIEIPTFSEEEVEAARQAGFAAGHQQGVSESMAGIESQIATLLDQIATNTGQLFVRQTETDEQISEDALTLVMSVARRLLPDLSAKNGLGEVTRVAQILLERLLTEPRVEIRVHDSLAQPLQERLEPFLEQRGFKGDLVILGEAEIAPGECKLEWSSGSADRNIERLWEGIEGAVEDSLLTQRAIETAAPAVLPTFGRDDTAAPSPIEPELEPDEMAEAATVSPVPADTGEMTEAASEAPLEADEILPPPIDVETMPGPEQITDADAELAGLDVPEPESVMETEAAAPDDDAEANRSADMGPPILSPLADYDPERDDEPLDAPSDIDSAESEADDPALGG